MESDIRAIARAAPRSLSLRNLLIFLLYYGESLSIEEAALTMGLTPEDVIRGLVEVRSTLKKAIRERPCP